MSKVTEVLGSNIPNVIGREYRLRAVYNGERIYTEAAKETMSRAGFRMMQFNFVFEWQFSNSASIIDLQLGHYNKLAPGAKTKFIKQGRCVVNIDDLVENSCRHETISMLTEPIHMEINVRVARVKEYRMQSPSSESHYLRSKSSVNVLSRLLSSRTMKPQRQEV